MAVILTYLSAALSGGVSPFWPHVVLLSVSVLAGAAVGAGIIFESPKYSAATHRLATWLVIGGVVAESLCTVCLFVFDEGISDVQQAEIISLRKAAAPRNIRGDEFRKIADALKSYGGTKYDLSLPPLNNPGFLGSLLEPGSYLPQQLITALRLSGWEIKSMEGSIPKIALPWEFAGSAVIPPSSSTSVPIPTIMVGQFSGIVGVRISWNSLSDGNLLDAAEALSKVLDSIGIRNDLAITREDGGMTPHVVHIILGSKP
jgi:hypothetical protein